MKYKKIFFITHHIQKYCGNIFDYFLENSEDFFVYSISLTFKDEPCIFEHYQNGKLVDRKEFKNHLNKSMPLKYIYYYWYFLKINIKIIPKRTIVINYHPLFCLFSSLFGVFKKQIMIFWIFDYFPSRKGFYFVYNKMVDFYNRNLDYVLYLGKGLEAVYSKKRKKYKQVIDLGIKKVNYERIIEEDLMGFVGNLKKYQGFEIILEAMEMDIDLKLEVMGTGAQKNEYEELAKSKGLEKRVDFLGYIKEEEVGRYVSRWQIGLAPYEPCEENCTQYAEPGKVKFYIQYGVPVIMTKITHVWEMINRDKAGVAVDYNSESLLQAIDEIQSNYDLYNKGVLSFQDEYEYQEYFARKFEFLYNIY